MGIPSTIHRFHSESRAVSCDFSTTRRKHSEGERTRSDQRESQNLVGKGFATDFDRTNALSLYAHLLANRFRAKAFRTAPRPHPNQKAASDGGLSSLVSVRPRGFEPLTLGFVVPFHYSAVNNFSHLRRTKSAKMSQNGVTDVTRRDHTMASFPLRFRSCFFTAFDFVEILIGDFSQHLRIGRIR